MANFLYTNAAVLFGTAALDVTSAMSLLLVNSGSNAQTLRTATTISAFGAGLNEHADASYTRKNLTGLVLEQDDVNFRFELHCDSPVTWAALAGSSVIAAVLYKRIGAGTFGDDASNIPVAWIDSGGFPKIPQGDDFDFNKNAEGILQIRA